MDYLLGGYILSVINDAGRNIFAFIVPDTSSADDHSVLYTYGSI